MAESNTGLNQYQKSQFEKLLLKHQSVFAKDNQDVGYTKLVQHQINVAL